MEDDVPSPSTSLLAVKDEETPNKGKLTGKLATAVFASVIGCSFQFGFQTGVLNNPQQLLQNEYKYGFGDHKNGTAPTLTEEQVRLYWSLTVSIYAVGGLVAGFTGSYMATKLGRKRMMMLINLVLLVGVALMVMARYVGRFELIIVGRAVAGLHSGFSTVVAPLYLNEISPVNLRGGVGTLHQLAVTIGILLSQILGLQEVLGNIHFYHILLGVPAVVSLLQLLILPFCPESPAWLYITKDRKEASQKALRELWGNVDIEPQLNSYSIEVMDQSKRSEVTFAMMFKERYLRTPLLIAVVMQLSQQLSGIIAILNYSTEIFLSIGLAKNNAQYATLGTSGAIVCMTLIGVPLMDRVGRKPLHLGGLSGCLFSMTLITIAMFVAVTHDWAKYLSIIALVLFIVSFAIGPGAIPWFITAELFDQAARPYAISIATAVNWTANFISGLVFPSMQTALGTYVFIPFIVLLLLFVLFTYFKVPETKNKPVEDVVAMFRD